MDSVPYVLISKKRCNFWILENNQIFDVESGIYENPKTQCFKDKYEQIKQEFKEMKR